MTKALGTVVGWVIGVIVAHVVLDTWLQSRETNRFIEAIHQHITEPKQ